MDPQNPAPPVATTAATSAAVSAITAVPQLQPPPSPPQTQPSPQPQPQQQPAPPSSATATPPISTPLPPSLNPNQNPNPNPNPNPRPSTPLPPHQSPLQHSQSLSRPPTALTRPWQQSHLAPLSSSAGISSSPSLYSSSSSSSSPPVLPPTSAPSPRGSVAIGVPAHRPSPTPSQSASFSPSYGHFAGLGRSGVNIPEPPPNSSASQVRPSMQGAQGIGMLGSLSSSSQMRPGGIPTHHQQRPGQSSLRPVSSPSNQLPSSQNYQGHSLLRVPPAGSPGSPSPSTSQSVQSLNQPWLASGSQGKPPLPSPSYRQPVNPQSLQQRSHIPPQPQPQLLSQSQLQSQQQQQQQQSHPLPMTSQQHVPTLLQQQQQQPPLPSQQAHEHYSKQIPPSRVPQALSHQQQITRVQASASTNQKLSTPPNVQPNTVQSGSHNRIATVETDESSNRILSKRSIHELVSQVDPSERLDPEVEDILIDIADDFIESITTFGCSLAKHRKSTTLEAKDILLHLERNWNITLPGFGSDEIKTFRKPLVNDIHKERLAAIKKSMLATETATTRNPGGQASGNAKGNLVKTSTNFIGSPNVKT